MKKYASFLGCLIPLRIPSVELAARKVFEKLSVKAVDLVGYSCCPDPLVSRLIDKRMWLALSARNLSLAEGRGLDIMTLCNGCYETLWEANEVLKQDPQIKREIDKDLSRVQRRYEGTVKVKHVVEVLHEDVGLNEIEKTIKRPRKFKAAVHYGCHLFKAGESEDIWKKPKMLEDLVRVAGAEVVGRHKFDRLCCGFPTMEVDEEFSLKERVHLKLKYYEKLEADCIVTPCPACITQFEIAQTLLRRYGIRHDFPCMHVLELLALALGIPMAELSLEFHRSPVPQFVQKLEDHDG